MSHTPGPWTADYNAAGELTIDSSVGPDYNRVAVIGLEEHCTPEDEANARLMAASPELVSALEGMLAEFGNQRFEVRRDFSKMVRIEAARRALAQARGE